MNVLPNSRKLNGISLAEYLQDDSLVTGKEDQYDYPIGLTHQEQESIVRKRYHNSNKHTNVKKHAVSKVKIKLDIDLSCQLILNYSH